MAQDEPNGVQALTSPEVARSRQDGDVSGTLALIGGSDFGEDAGHHRQLFDPGTTVQFLPTAMAYEDPAGAIERARAHFGEMDNEIDVIPAMTRADAADASIAGNAAEAKAVYVTGGSPMHLRSVLKDTPLLGALLEAWSGGATVAVAAESCSVLCGHMVDNRGGAFTVGLGLITTLTVIPRFDHWSPDKRSRTISLAPPELIVAGIDEATALVRSPDGTWSVTGSGSVNVFRDDSRVGLDELPKMLNPDAGF